MCENDIDSQKVEFHLNYPLPANYKTTTFLILDNIAQHFMHFTTLSLSHYRLRPWRVNVCLKNTLSRPHWEGAKKHRCQGITARREEQIRLGWRFGGRGGGGGISGQK